MKQQVQLGDTATDSVSGFTGTVVARHAYLNGCDRFTVQPRINDKGEVPDAHAFDEPQLTAIERGLEKYIDEGRA